MVKPASPEAITKTTIRFPTALVIAAKHRAIDDGVGFQDVVIRALEQYLRTKGGR
jgi:predicted DNA binding CopG/RHH family protein